MEKKPKVALSIAGSDPSSGAGIQADLKAFSFLGIHGITAITCITAQNTRQVKQIYRIPVDLVEQQIDVLLDDVIPDAMKTGMLYDADIIRLVTHKIVQYKMKPVVDPVMVATSGDSLAHQTFLSALKKELLPKTYMLTANVPEASALVGRNITTIEDMKTACKDLHHLGSRYVLIKGGHLTSNVVSDVAFDGKIMHVFSLPRISGKKLHGTGCTLSALIAGLLAYGKTPIEAVKQAKYLLWDMINRGYVIGKGVAVTNTLSGDNVQLPSLPTDDHVAVWFAVKTTVDTVLSVIPRKYIPEVGMNIGYALPHAKTLNDVCAVNGRIVKTKDAITTCGKCDFGVSKHVASIILAAMSVDPTVRCAINIKYAPKHLEQCRKAGLTIGSFDRTQEPKNARSTMEWGTTYAIQHLGRVPDVIYDIGGIGKEPMIRILGKNPDDVIAKVHKIINQNLR